MLLVLGWNSFMNVEKLENGRNSSPYLKALYLTGHQENTCLFFINLKYRIVLNPFVLSPCSLCSHRSKHGREKMQIEMWYPYSDGVCDYTASGRAETGFCYWTEKSWHQYKGICVNTLISSILQILHWSIFFPLPLFYRNAGVYLLEIECVLL